MSHTIALVDDDRNLLTSISIALEREGFKVQTYIDGESALIGLTRTPPDLAIIDIKMPKMDGEELLKKQVKVVIVETNNSNLNYRKSYYEYEQIENVKYFNKMFNYIYYIFLLIFIFYTLITLKDYKSPVTYTLISILLLLPIFIVPLIVKSIFSVYDYFIDLYDSKVPKDVFTNI